ncbi:MAG: hypothetical protein HYR55_04255 [Acidobacteria bacterium]|nr:hypothetical protein [Acidobacteriota bacterium]MBI3658671.1 hypothetical protein [Acidobacteriota bacterium]
MVKTNILFLILVFSLLTIDTVRAQCPQTLPSGRWIYSPVEIFDVTSLPAGGAVIAAANWNVAVQNNISLTTVGPYADIYMLDNTGLPEELDNTGLPEDMIGATTLFSQLAGICACRLSVCGFRCLDDSVILQARVEINSPLVLLRAQQYGYDATTAAANIEAHEFGHALSGLFDVARVKGDPCDAIQSIMYRCSLCGLFFGCGLTGPRIPCDSAPMLSAYPQRITDSDCPCYSDLQCSGVGCL